MTVLQNKQEFINACNNENGIKFIQVSAAYLECVSAKDELNDFVNVFGKISKIKSLEASTELTGLCLSLRSKVYDILIANGDVPESNYIYLYDYFTLCSLPEDARYSAYEQFVDQNLYGDGVSDMERVYLIVLRFFASMANSREYAFEKFLLSSMRLHLLEVGSVGFSKFVSDYLDDSRVQIESVLLVLEKIWDKEFYFSLDKTQRRSTFNWSLHSLWLVQKYFNHPSWVSLYPKWKEIFYEHIARDECDEAMYVHFFVYHKMGNSFQTQAEWKMFNEDIDRPASKYYAQWCERANLPKCKAVQSDGKKLIGFLQDRLVMNSPFKVQYSLWRVLLDSEGFREQYDIKIYLMGYFEKSGNDKECIDMVQRLGIDVFDGAAPFYAAGVYHSHLEKALYIRERMLSDGVDILVSPNNGYDISDFLVVGRVAPKQIYWSHGNHEYDVGEIDKKITHCGLQGCDYKFETFTVPMDTEAFYNPYRDSRLIEHERARYPKDAFVLGVIGRLIKVDSDEYLETIAKIMRQNQNTIFVAAGSGNMDSIKTKVEKLGIADRFYMPGHVDAHLYGYVIDLFLNTFPLSQGESIAEYEAKAKVCLTIIDNQNYIKDVHEYLKTDESQKFRTEYGYDEASMFKYGDPLGLQRYACGKEEFIDRASELIRNEALLDDLQILVARLLDYNQRKTAVHFAEIFTEYLL